MSRITDAVRKGIIPSEAVEGIQGDKEAEYNASRYIDKLDSIHSRARRMGGLVKIAPWIIDKVKEDIKEIKKKKRKTKKDREQLKFYKETYDVK